MNNLLLLCGFFLLLNGTRPEQKKEPRFNDNQKENTLRNINDSYLINTALVINAESDESISLSAVKEQKEKELNLASITYIEEEEELDLGFNTEDYLPRGFNPYEAYFDIHSITYIEDEIEFEYYFDIHTVDYIEENKEVELAFNTEDYLPRGFNPYEAYFDIHSITYIEDEIEFEYYFDIHTVDYIEENKEVELAFNTEDYLPRGFNPYEAYFDIHSITYIEDEIEFEYYFDIHTIDYVEDEIEVKLDFNTKKYLPKGFNAYAKPSVL